MKTHFRVAHCTIVSFGPSCRYRPPYLNGDASRKPFCRSANGGFDLTALGQPNRRSRARRVDQPPLRACYGCHWPGVPCIAVSCTPKKYKRELVIGHSWELHITTLQCSDTQLLNDPATTQLSATPKCPRQPNCPRYPTVRDTQMPATTLLSAIPNCPRYPTLQC